MDKPVRNMPLRIRASEHAVIEEAQEIIARRDGGVLPTRSHAMRVLMVKGLEAMRGEGREQSQNETAGAREA